MLTDHTFIAPDSFKSDLLIAGAGRWLFLLGALLTGGALFAAAPPAVTATVMGSGYVLFGLAFAQLMLAFGLADTARRMEDRFAAVLLSAYGAMTGVIFTVFFTIYASFAFAGAFLLAAGVYAAVSVYGAMRLSGSKTDATGVAGQTVMGFIGFALVSAVNLMFFHEAAYWLTTYMGLAIFFGLTAYDLQHLRAKVEAAAPEEEPEVTPVPRQAASSRYRSPLYPVAPTALRASQMHKTV